MVRQDLDLWNRWCLWAVMGGPERSEAEEVTIYIGEKKVCLVKGVFSFHM